MKVLSEKEVKERLNDLKGWTHSSQGIQRTFTLDGFPAVMRLVNRVAELAEAADHHPDMFISYDKVTFTLITHDAGGITGKDFDLASRIEQAAGPR